MALDPTRRSRRSLLAAAAAAAAATVAQAVVRPLPVAAAGDDGMPVTVGSQFNDARSTTRIRNASNNLPVFIVESYTPPGSNGGIAIFGYSDDGTAVKANSNLGIGLAAFSATGPGVTSSSITGTGVHGESQSGIGVHGSSDSGYAVRGNGAIGAGVYGNATSGQGVIGDATTGTGVLASSASGRALDVAGKAHFNRSGVATVRAGTKSVTVTVTGGLSGTPMCFANLRSYRSGIGVAAVRPNYPSAGKVRIYLTKTVSSATSVAWLVLD